MIAKGRIFVKGISDANEDEDTNVETIEGERMAIKEETCIKEETIVKEIVVELPAQ